MELSINTDVDLQLELLAQSVYSKPFLDEVGDVLDQNDFRPLSNTDTFSWIVAGLAIEFYCKNRVPIANLIGHETMRWCDESGAGDDRRKRAQGFIVRLTKIYDPARIE